MFPFVRAVLRHFFQIGGICPSSPFAAGRVVGLVPENSQTLVEFGPGTGAVTRKLIQKLSATGKLYAVDLNPEFIQILDHFKDPRIHAYCGDVLEFIETMRTKEPDGVDYVISGIPLSFLDDPSRETLLKHTKSALKPGGKFIIYQNSPEALALMKRHFHHVKMLIELRNIPPYFIIAGTV